VDPRDGMDVEAKTKPPCWESNHGRPACILVTSTVTSLYIYIVSLSPSFRQNGLVINVGNVRREHT
jgi:hypothetical protein